MPIRLQLRTGRSCPLSYSNPVYASHLFGGVTLPLNSLEFLQYFLPMKCLAVVLRMTAARQGGPRRCSTRSAGDGTRSAKPATINPFCMHLHQGKEVPVTEWKCRQSRGKGGACLSPSAHLCRQFQHQVHAGGLFLTI